MERPELIDLAIIGGGPAGCAAALEARRRGLSVAVRERDRFPRDKVCGEFLSAESLPLLEQEIPQVLEQGAVIRRSEFISPRGRVYSFALPNPGRGLSRRGLDAALWEAAVSARAEAREGVMVRGLRRRELNGQQKAAWEVRSTDGTSFRAKAVIVACGRWWMLDGFPSPARQVNAAGENGKSNGVGQWLGAKAHFKGVAPHDAVEMYFFRGGYCGLAPIEGGLYNACCLVHRRLARVSGASGFGDFAAWLRSVAGHAPLDSRLRGATQVSETIATAPVCPKRRSPEHDGAMMVGDAAGFLDPFTGDGISMALHSGRLAVDQLARVWSQELATADRGIVRSYGDRLGHAVRHSYAVAGLLRALVCAPARMQSVAAVALPWIGGRLHAATRWQK